MTQTTGPEIMTAAEIKSLVDQCRWREVKREWLLVAEAALLLAEAETNGYLLSAEGRAAGIDPFMLWTGTEASALKYASEELLEHWSRHPRVTVSAYREGLRADRAARRAQGAE